jgi:dUTP pyrophosphatase
LILPKFQKNATFSEMKINVHRVDSTLPLPKYQTTGSCAFDFIARETITIEPHAVGFVPGNLIIKVPEGHSLLILPRSSLFRKKSLLIPNSPGLIDCDYCGPEDEIKIQVLNFGTENVTVERGERIAQGLFVKSEQAKWMEIEQPNGDSRGGFGSTGHI